jgi:uncharacterized surface protein with fasciclin (FAS1) repeats
MKQKWMLSAAVAGLLGCTACGAFAQTTAGNLSTTPTTLTSNDTTMTPAPDTGWGTGPRMSTGDFADGTPDYTLLNNKSFDYTDLLKARSSGFSDNEIATMAKIAHETGEPFHEIAEEAQDGITFSTMASNWGLNIGNLYDNQDEKTRIANYVAAYETTGRFAHSGSSAMMAAPITTTLTETRVMAMTPASDDVIGVISSDRRFRTLSRLLNQAGLVSALEGPGPFTIFAPTNEAFRKIPRAQLRELAANGQLAQILKYHVIPARIDAATALAMTNPTSPATLEGSTIQVTSSAGNVTLNGNATVVTPDIRATNGVIHAIDTVLMPPDLSSTTASTMPAAP